MKFFHELHHIASSIVMIGLSLTFGINDIFAEAFTLAFQKMPDFELVQKWACAVAPEACGTTDHKLSHLISSITNSRSNSVVATTAFQTNFLSCNPLGWNLKYASSKIYVPLWALDLLTLNQSLMLVTQESPLLCIFKLCNLRVLYNYINKRVSYLKCFLSHNCLCKGIYLIVFIYASIC